MLTQKPQITTVRVQIRELKAGKYVRSETMTFYETTAPALRTLIQRAVAKNGTK
jgi:hypothetical protein